MGHCGRTRLVLHAHCFGTLGDPIELNANAKFVAPVMHPGGFDVNGRPASLVTRAKCKNVGSLQVIYNRAMQRLLSPDFSMFKSPKYRDGR